MFDPNARRIAPLKHAWPSLLRGQLMTLVYDTETSGLGQQGAPYATPNYPFLTEWGDCLVDIAGNYLNSAQVNIRMPEWGVPEIGAAHLQRLENGPYSFFDENRTPYMNGIASIVDRMESARFAYGDFFKDPETGKFVEGSTEYLNATEHYATSKGQRTRQLAETVIPIPFMLDGQVVDNYVRYHPFSKKLSLRLSMDSNQFNYLIEEKNFYMDKSDNSQWITVDPMLNLAGFNNRAYDLGVVRRALERAGFTPRDTALLTRRAKAVSKQRGKFTHQDVRDLAFAVAQFGPQNEHGLHLPKYLDEKGNLRATEALSEYLEANQDFANVRRFAQTGIRMPNDGSKHDPAFDHGAHYDAAGTMALLNKARDVAPEIAAEYDSQTHAKSIYLHLAPRNNLDQLPIHLLPRREQGLSHIHKPYYYLGTDDQIGGYGQHIFLMVDGSLHTTKYKDKALIDLTAAEWKDYLTLDSTKKNPDSPVRVISENRLPMAVPFEQAMKNMTVSEDWKKEIPNIIKDCNYLLGGLNTGSGPANFPMMDHIFDALEEINIDRQNKSHAPQVPTTDDMLYHSFSPLSYLVAETDAEYFAYKEKNPKHKSGTPIQDKFHTIKGTAENVFNRWMYEIDDTLRDLAIKALPIDNYLESDFSYTNYSDNDHAAQVFNEFKELMERTYTKLKEKNKSRDHEHHLYLDVLDSIENPATGKPYFQKGKFKVNSLREAVEFRRTFGKRMMDDYIRVMNFEGSRALQEYVDGYVDKYFCMQTIPSGKEKGHILVLAANADHGAPPTRATPEIVDKAGRVINIDTIHEMPSRDVIKNIRSNEWDIRFRRVPSDPMMERLVQRFHNLGWKDDVPEELQLLYRARLQTALHGMPNETVDTARAPSLETRARNIEAVKLNAVQAAPTILERSQVPSKGIAADLSKNEEWERTLILEQDWNKERKAQYPYIPELTLLTHHDEESNRPLDFIEHQVLRDESLAFTEDPNFIVIDVPLFHVRNPIRQTNPEFHQNLLVVKDTLTPAQKRQINDITNGKSGKKIILREPESGRLYTTGHTTVKYGKDVPALDSDKHSVMMQKAQNDYAQSGMPLTSDDKLLLLEIEDVYPLTNTRNYEDGLKGIYLPKDHHMTLYAPHLNALGGKEPLSATIMIADYQTQTEFKPGEMIRLWETDSEKPFSHVFGQPGSPTGFVFDTTIEDTFGMEKDAQGKVKGMALKDFLAAAKTDENLRSAITRAGFTGGRHLEEVILKDAVEKNKEEPLEQPVIAITFKPVNVEYQKQERDERYNTALNLTGHFKAAAAALRREDKVIVPANSNYWDDDCLALQA